MTTKLEVFVDYVCPFCFLVEEAIEELRDQRDVEIEVQPFELRPDPVPTLRPEDDYLPRIWGASVYPMARRLGMEISLPTISPQPRTDKAFVVLQLAKEHGVGQAYSEAVFRAFFQRDRNIGEDEVIVDVAESVGLNRPDVVAALASQDRRHRQQEDQDFAVNSVGVSAVPSFRVDGRLASGVLSAEQLIRLVDGAGATRAVTLTAPKLQAVMEEAVEECITHVDGGGLPFVGVVVGASGVISKYGVNRVQETSDPCAHAEIVAMRDALASQGRDSLAGTTLVATGEPCGLCYRFAIDHQVTAIYVAVDRDAVAEWGFDYRASYSALGISDDQRSGLLHHLPVERGAEPFARYLRIHTHQPSANTLSRTTN